MEVYIDDMVVKSKQHEENILNLVEVFEILGIISYTSTLLSVHLG